jgi:ribosomal protein L35
MARQKTNKTARKRIKLSKPRGNKVPKLIYKQSHQGHLRTGKSAREKRRQKDNAQVDKSIKNTLIRKIVNI